MLNAVSINTEPVQPVHIKIGWFDKAQAENTQNGYLSNITQSSLKDIADAIKNANEINTGKVNNVQENESINYIKTKEEKLAEAKANLDEAKKKLEAAMKEFETRQKQLTSLREKMRNVQDPVKKARYNVAYDMLKAEFECAKAKFRAAEGEVLKLQKKIELLEAEQTNEVEQANANAFGVSNKLG